MCYMKEEEDAINYGKIYVQKIELLYVNVIISELACYAIKQ